MYDGPINNEPTCDYGLHDNLIGGFNPVSYSDHTNYDTSNDKTYVTESAGVKQNYSSVWKEPYVWKETTVKDIEETYRDCFGEEMPKEEKFVNDECGYPIEVDTNENFDALTDKYLAYRNKCENLEKKVSNLEETIGKVDTEKRELEEKIVTYRILTIILGCMTIIPIACYLLGFKF